MDCEIDKQLDELDDLRYHKRRVEELIEEYLKSNHPDADSKLISALIALD